MIIACQVLTQSFLIGVFGIEELWTNSMLLQLEIGSVCSPTWATWLYDNYNVSVFASMSAAFYNAYLVVIQLRTSRCHKLA